MEPQVKTGKQEGQGELKRAYMLTSYGHYEAALRACERCGDPKRPHRVCPSCGYYRNEAVVEVEID